MSAAPVHRQSDVQSPFEPASVRAALKGVTTHMPALTKGLWLTICFAMIGTSGRLVVPLVIQRVAGVIATEPIDTDRALTILGVGALLSAFASSVQVLAIRRLGAGAETGLAQARLRAVNAMHRLSIEQQTMAPRGQLISRLTTDLDDISSYLSSGLINLALSVLQIIVVAIVMVWWAWPLALIVAICTAIFAIIGVRVQLQIAPAFTQAREKAGTMQAVLAETIMGAEVIQTFDIAERTQQRVLTAIDETRRVETRGGSLSALFSGITLWYQAIVVVATIVASVVMVAHGQLELGVALAFPFLVNMFTDPMKWFGESITGAQMTLASWRRVCGLLDTVPAIADPAETGTVQSIPNGPVAIDLEHVSITYTNGDHPALTVPSLHIPPREQVAVVGETGSGKTTLSKLVTRLLLPTTGVIRIGGIDLAHVGERDLREKILMIPQDDVLMASSLRSNLWLAKPGADDATFIHAMDDLGLLGWLHELPLGLDTPLGERGANLSAGQRQLIGLIRAHLASPQILVLDEATSALDPATERLVRHAMQTLVADRTTITIAHRLSTAAEADRILVIDDGHIIEDGSHRELLALTGGRYATLWAAWEHGTQ
ncbi:ABC transporter ATP-binding protein [Stomatohabitans albus]|uniref:ABC transporter ATP-binding protein n=1 Tax=Stomatohabitans albus TaxID=3110766 RepID=UPI00300C5331